MKIWSYIVIGGLIFFKNGWFFKLETLTYPYGISFLFMMKNSWKIQNQSYFVASFHLYSVKLVLPCRPRFEFQILDFWWICFTRKDSNKFSDYFSIHIYYIHYFPFSAEKAKCTLIFQRCVKSNTHPGLKCKIKRQGQKG